MQMNCISRTGFAGYADYLATPNQLAFFNGKF